MNLTVQMRRKLMTIELTNFINCHTSFRPWQHWGFMGLVSYKRLLDDAEDSPVVDDEGDENQLMGGILVTYSF